MNWQLLILRTSQGLLDCILRPAKDFTEQQYLGAVHIIKPGKLTGPFVWGKAEDGQAIMLLGDGRRPGLSLCVHTVAPALTKQGQSVGALRLAFKLHALLETHRHVAQVFLPEDLVSRTVFHEHVPLTLLSDATEALNLFDRQGPQLLSFPPKLAAGSKWTLLWHQLRAVPLHTEYLVRTVDFGQACFCEDTTTLHSALHRMMSWRAPPTGS